MKIQYKSTYASSGTISEVNVKVISVIKSDSDYDLALDCIGTCT